MSQVELSCFEKKAEELVKSVIIEKLDDLQAAIVQGVENLQRQDLSEAEKSRFLAFIAVKFHLSAKQISAMLRMSYTWVVRYLPSEFKNDAMSELGQKGGESRATSLVANRESEDEALRVRAELAEAELKARQHQTQCQNPSCLKFVPDEEIKYVGEKPYCKSCAPNMHVAYEKERKRLEREKETKEKPVTPRQLSTQQDKEAERHVLHSKQELEFVKLAEDDGGFGPVIQDRTFGAVPSVPDAYFPRLNWIVYVDGDVHEGKEDADETRRQLIARANKLRLFVFKIGVGKPKDWIKKLRESVVLVPDKEVVTLPGASDHKEES